MAMSTPLVSVVVPVYNVETYLRECVDSILAQTHTNLEVILVNDGSTDESLAIMREYETADSRVRVIDKPNGGYGHSVNQGIEAATGQWLSIIEPDDIITNRMYQDLLANAQLESGGLADIVKSSYWLYYDAHDGQESRTEAPNLAQFMPRERTEFTALKSNEILYHHPSIWSALYRRDFIEKHHIRMIEPQGAGWADNPWFFDTLLQADSIVWWPGAYYYYRQTNPNASSKAPDYHLPFDRLRDMRSILTKLGLDSDERVLVPLYNRTFCYILYSVLDEYGYDESAPELQILIREALGAMDENVVLTARQGIPANFVSYYRDVMGIHVRELRPVSRSTNPLLSIVLAFGDDSRLLWPTIESLTSQEFTNFEVLCIGAGRDNRCADIVRDVATIDQRFQLFELNTPPSCSRTWNAGLAHAHGDFVQFMRAGTAYPWPTDLAHILSQAHALLPSSRPHVAGSGHADSIASSSAEIITMTEQPLPVELLASVGAYQLIKACALPCQGNEEAVFSLSGAYVATKIFNRAFLDMNELRFFENENGYSLVVRAFTAASQLCIVRGGTPDTSYPIDCDTASLHTSEALTSYSAEILHELTSALDDPHAQACARAALGTEGLRLLDLSLSEHGGASYYNEVLSTLQQALPSSTPAAPSREMTKLEEIAGVSYEEFIERKAKHFYLNHVGGPSYTQAQLARSQAQVARIRNSTSFKLGSAIVRAGRKVIPRRVR